LDALLGLLRLQLFMLWVLLLLAFQLKGTLALVLAAVAAGLDFSPAALPNLAPGEGPVVT